MTTLEYTGVNRIAGQESVPDFKHSSQQVAPYSRIQVAEQFRNNEQQCSSRFEFIRRVISKSRLIPDSSIFSGI